MRTKNLSRILTTLIAVIMVLSLVGCTKTVTESHTDENGNTVTTTTVTDNNGTTVTETSDAEEEIEEEIDEEIDEEVEAEGVYESLQDYYSVEENYNYIVDGMTKAYEETKDTYDDISFNCLDNSFEYVYAYLEMDDEDVEATAEGLSEYFDEIDDETLEDAKWDIIGDSGIAYDDVEFSFVYTTIDGEEIFRITF